MSCIRRVSFNGADGQAETGSLIADAYGNLYGTTSGGGVYGFGSVFEIAKTANGYATTPTTLVSFNGPDGQFPQGSLILDAAGNLYGTTSSGGANYTSSASSAFVGSGYGTVFEIAKTVSGYSTTPTTLVSFNGTNGSQPFGNLIADAAGNLYGTTDQGTNSPGTVFEIAKTASGFASTPTTIANFNETNFYSPQGSLIFDAAGDIFGTTFLGVGTSLHGAVFEISNTANGYSSIPTLVAGFSSSYGAYPGAYSVDPARGLISDAAGNLYGTTTGGGAFGQGSVFEIAKTANGYATTPTILVSFNGTNGGAPKGTLIVDAAGDLYGTTANGGAYGFGTVFEIAKTTNGYATQPTSLISFNLKNGLYPQGSLIADANGDLFGTTYYGGSYGAPDGYGTVFEITGTGFVTFGSSPLSVAAVLAESRNGQLTSAVSISDTAANLQSNLDAIEAVAVSSITLTDTGIPTLSVTSAQTTNDAAALRDISGNFSISQTVSSGTQTIAGVANALGNTAVFTGNSSQYTITPAGDGVNFTVANASSSYQLSDIQALQFADYTEIVAPTPGSGGSVTGGNVTELYGAVFGRVPDVQGLNYYEKELAANPGLTLTILAQNFLSSPEYTGNSAHAYAQTSAGDAQFITDCYTNLLNRVPESGAVPYYQNLISLFIKGLTPGTAAYAAAELQGHATVLVDFSASAEFLGDVQVTATNPASSGFHGHWLALI